MNVNEAVQAYQEQRPTYEQFTAELSNLVEKLLNAEAIDYTIEHRTKEIGHFREKITRAGKNYIDPLEEITDLCGLRVILRRISDVAKVVELIRDEFDIDEPNSTDKEEELEVDQFGYLSVHLVVQLKEDRTSLREWKHLKQLKAEIQVRTVLQHAWALISHGFDYKARADIPRPIRRQLFRLSALLEVADTEFDQIAKDIEELLERYKTEVSEGNTSIELNVDSLRIYIETAPEVQYWLDFLRTEVGTNIKAWDDLSVTMLIAKQGGIDTLNKLKSVVQEAKGWGEVFFKDYYTRYSTEYELEPADLTTPSDIVVAELIIATYAESFTPALIFDLLGTLSSRYILNAALAARRPSLGPP